VLVQDFEKFAADEPVSFEACRTEASAADEIIERAQALGSGLDGSWVDLG
jgi:hypothetical protein